MQIHVCCFAHSGALIRVGSMWRLSADCNRNLRLQTPYWVPPPTYTHGSHAHYTCQRSKLAHTTNMCFSQNLSNIKHFHRPHLVAKKKRNHTVQSVQRRAAGWEIQGSNQGEGKILSLFHTLSNRLWGPPNNLYIGYRWYFPVVKRLGSGVFHTTPNDACVKNGWRYTSTTHLYPHGLL